MWYEGPPMEHTRKNSSACALNESIYVFGGFDIQDKPLQSIERLNALKLITQSPINDVSWSLKIADVMNLGPVHIAVPIN